jgi:beta-galactosidase/beta-glucuronidase
MNYTNKNIPTMTQEIKLDENKKLSIIDTAREAVKNFPEKLNATHKEIIDLVDDYNNYEQ